MALYENRKRANAIWLALCYASVLFGLTFLVLILVTLFWNGFSGISLKVFTQSTPAPDSEGAKAFAAVAERVWEKVSGTSAARGSGPRIVVE